MSYRSNAAHAREELIRKALASPVERTRRLTYIPKEARALQDRAAVGLPVYRMANGRTSVEQLAY